MGAGLDVAADYGNLASLFDVQIVSQLRLGESGK